MARQKPSLVPTFLVQLLTPTREQWNQEEILRLNEAIKLFRDDKGWSRIASHVKTKDRSQIRNFVKCNLGRKKK